MINNIFTISDTETYDNIEKVEPIEKVIENFSPTRSNTIGVTIWNPDGATVTTIQCINNCSSNCTVNLTPSGCVLVSK